MPEVGVQERVDARRVRRRGAPGQRPRRPTREATGSSATSGCEHIDPDDLRIRRWGDIADGTTFTNVFRPGQVLFGKRRAYQRKVAVADFDGICSGDIYVFEPKTDALLPELLPFICQTDAFFEHAVGTSAGSLSPRTNWTSLASYEFALPPLEEQRRIASRSAASSCFARSCETLREQLRASVCVSMRSRRTRRVRLARVRRLASCVDDASMRTLEHVDSRSTLRDSAARVIIESLIDVRQV